jgi:hypothetical protein
MCILEVAIAEDCRNCGGFSLKFSSGDSLRVFLTPPYTTFKLVSYEEDRALLVCCMDNMVFDNCIQEKGGVSGWG